MQSQCAGASPPSLGNKWQQPTPQSVPKRVQPHMHLKLEFTETCQKLQGALKMHWLPWFVVSLVDSLKGVLLGDALASSSIALLSLSAGKTGVAKSYTELSR